MRGVVLSGIQPSGELHIGNYFGAIQNWVKLQEDFQCYFMVVDLHAMTKEYNPQDLRRNTTRMLIDLLAVGVDPLKSTLFIQSAVPEHAELCWIFNCLASYGELGDQPQFKIEVERSEGKFISAGFFTYPVLQAADILLYKADHVPVGEDQRHHLELTSRIARRFNAKFGSIFPEPKILTTETPRIHSLADPTKKMSKSLGPKHYIGMFEEESSIRAKIKSAVTDMGTLPAGVEMSPGVTTLFEILRACGKNSELDSLSNDYANGNRQYSHLKEAVADAVVDLTNQFRGRRLEIEKNQERAMWTITEMAKVARDKAKKVLKEVRENVGLPAMDFASTERPSPPGWGNRA